MRKRFFVSGFRTASLAAISGLVVALTGSLGFAQSDGRQQAAPSPDVSGIKLNPGERIISVDGVPVSSSGSQGANVGSTVQGYSAANRGGVVQASATSGGGAAVAGNIEGNLVNSGQPFSHTPGATALDKANRERLRNGVQALIPDPQLQRLALRKARLAASRGIKNHVGGSLGGARAEGVGHTNGRFLSCCLDMPATYGGAAMVQGRDGWYCCLLVR